EEAFLVGLLQDCGILFLVQLLGLEYAEFVRSFNGSRTAFYEEEKKRFRFDHVQTVAALAREWKLPEAIVGPLEVHHTKPELSSDSTDLDLLSGIGYLVGSIGLADGVVDDPGLAEYAATGLGLDEELLGNCIQRAGEAYSEIGRLLQETLPDDLDVTDLLSRANTCLNSAARDAERRADVVKAERDEYAQQQVHLQNALGEYRERAARDPLTGILNRGALVEAAREQLRHAREQNRSITVLFLDIDNFKSLNDRFGHQAGDNVLIGVAEAIVPVIRNSGILGRYGGEEFVAIVGGLLEAEARRFAEEVVDTFRRTEWPGLGLPGPVTCSLGAVWGIPGPDDCAEGLFSAADELMYQAKRAGKDRAVFRSLSDPRHKAKSSAAADALVTAVNRQDMAESSVVPADYIRIAKELSLRTPSRFSTNRKQKRKPLIAPCKLATFTGANFGLSNEVGCVRDISSGGIGILTSTDKRRGEPIEVAIHTTEKPSLYVAGIVAWCRHIEGCVHEVGIQLFTHAREPILSADPISAIRNLDWVASALTTLTPEAETGGH
ncbi:MAG: diguanylate cyclase, partial [Planctomycetota bacterium]|nr:diguanylate cyclase [Planctomycetota bacterium]